MRLTLRTLLAWIDGVLTPEEQRLIGERVSGSRVATRLTARIRAVAARGPSDPPGTACGRIADDPNLVAEYLDNTLSPEYLEAFERTCIESARHLAEVGACHGMLAELLRRPELEHAAKPDRGAGFHDRVARLLSWVRACREAEAVDGPLPGAAPPAGEAGESRNAARATVTTLMAAAVPSSLADGAPQGTAAWLPRGRAARVAWLSACALLPLVLALGGVLASFGKAREFRPEPGCLRCTEP